MLRTVTGLIPPLLCNLGVGEPQAGGYEYLARSSRQLGGVSCVPRLRSAALASADAVLNSGGHPNLPPEHASLSVSSCRYPIAPAARLHHGGLRRHLRKHEQTGIGGGSWKLMAGLHPYFFGTARSITTTSGDASAATRAAYSPGPASPHDLWGLLEESASDRFVRSDGRKRPSSTCVCPVTLRSSYQPRSCGTTHVTVAPPMAPRGSTTRRPPSRWA